MPLDFASPLSRYGAVGGGVAGGGALSTLAKLLEPLDYPRRALWNLPGKLAEGDFAAAAPGLAGLATGGIAALLSGGSLPLAMLAGSVAGGLGQAAGTSLDEERFVAPTGEDLVSSLGGDPETPAGTLASVLSQMAGDPLLYTGSALGARGGAAAGRAYAPRLEAVARWDGPGFPGGFEKVSQGGLPDSITAAAQATQLQRHPAMAEIMSEVRPGGVMTGGEDSLVFLYPDRGYATTIRGLPTDTPVPPPPRFDVPEMMPAARSKPFVGTEGSPGVRVDHSPLGATGRDLSRTEASQVGDTLWDSLYDQHGLTFIDNKPGNFAQLPTGNWAVIDADSILPRPSGLSDPLRAADDLAGAPGFGVEHWLARKLGGPEGVREELMQRLSDRSRTAGIPVPLIGDNPLMAQMRNQRSRIALMGGNPNSSQDPSELSMILGRLMLERLRG